MVSWTRYGRAYPAIRLIVPGLSFCLVTDGSIRNPPLAIANPGPCTITRPMLVRPQTGYGMVFRQANTGPHSLKDCPGAEGLPPGGAAPAPQRYPGLSEDAVDEPVGPPGRYRQGTDGLSGVVPALQVGRQLVAVFSRDAGAFSEGRGFGHLLPPVRFSTHC